MLRWCCRRLRRRSGRYRFRSDHGPDERNKIFPADVVRHSASSANRLVSRPGYHRGAVKGRLMFRTRADVLRLAGTAAAMTLVGRPVRAQTTAPVIRMGTILADS